MSQPLPSTQIHPACLHKRQQTSIGPTTNQINHLCLDCKFRWTTFPQSEIPSTRPREQIDADMVERACRAHWPSFDRMRPDHAAEKRVKIQAALAAALYGGTLRP